MCVYVCRHCKSLHFFSMEFGSGSLHTRSENPPPVQPNKPHSPQQLGSQHFKSQVSGGGGFGAAQTHRAPPVRGLSCYFRMDSYLRGPADFKQVEPVGVPMVDDVG